MGKMCLLFVLLAVISRVPRYRCYDATDMLAKSPDVRYSKCSQSKGKVLPPATYFVPSSASRDAADHCRYIVAN